MQAQITHWPRIWVAFTAGCLATFHYGKVSAALTPIIRDLQLDLVQAGLVLSMVAAVAACVAAVMGWLSDRLGHVRLAVAGLLVSGVGSFIGMHATGFAHLLASRLVEGMGYIIAAVALPSLVSRSASERDRPLAMGIWGGFMPAGIAICLLLAPTLIAWHGWRGMWGDIGWASLLWAGVLVFVFRGEPGPRATASEPGDSLLSVFKRGPLLVFAGFFAYSSMFVPIAGFLPTMLVDEHGMTVASAARLVALAIAVNVLGNILGGWLIGRGVQPWKVITTAFVGMGVFGGAAFAVNAGAIVATGAAMLFAIFGGMYPGAAFTLASRFASKPSHMAIMAGLLLQGAGIGQTAGPVIVGALVEHLGAWRFGALEFVFMSIFGLGCAQLLKRTRSS